MIKSILGRDQFKLIYSKPFQSLTVNAVKAIAMFVLIKILDVILDCPITIMGQKYMFNF